MNSNEHVSQSQLARNRIADDLRLLMRDAEQMISAARQDSTENLAAMRDKLQTGLRQARDQVCEREHALVDQARHGAEQANQYVHVHPWTSMGVAAGAGLLIGALLARR